MCKIALLILILASVGIGCIKLPSFIPRCQAVDNVCMITAANQAIQVLLNGYKPFGIPSSMPAKKDRIEIVARTDLNFTLLNGEVQGLETLQVTNISISEDLKKWTLEFINNSTAVLDGDYEANGVLIIFPFQGSGKCHAELDTAKAEHDIYFNIVEKEGKKYLEQIKHIAIATMIRVHFHLDNLFNGNKILGDNLNNFMNENWKEVEKEFHSAFEVVLVYWLNRALDPILKDVPIDEMFL